MTPKTPLPDKTQIEPLESVEVVAHILDALASSSSPLGVTELARALNETKSRIHRNLVSLKYFGFIDQEEVSEKYRLGWKLFQLGQRAGSEFDVRKITFPYLNFLSATCGLSSLLAIPFNGQALVMDAVSNEGNVSISVKPGNRPLPHCSAQGRVALAYATPAQRERLLAPPLESPSPLAMTDPKAILKRLHVIQDQLYEHAPNETLMGINVLSVPLFKNEGELIGVLSLVGSVQHLPAKPEPKTLALLQGCASVVSKYFQNNSYDHLGLKSTKALKIPPVQI